MVAPVLGIGRLVMPPIQRLLLAVADRFDPPLRNSQVNKEFGRFIGAFLAERQIVFCGTSLITVTTGTGFRAWLFGAGFTR